MKLDSYTERAELAMQRAAWAAVEYGHQCVEPPHLLLGLIATSGGAVDVLTEAGVDTCRIRDEIESLRGSRRDGGERSDHQPAGTGRSIVSVR